MFVEIDVLNPCGKSLIVSALRYVVRTFLFDECFVMVVLVSDG